MSRADITVDLLIPGGLSDVFLRQSAVTRSRATRAYWNNHRLESFYVGAGPSEIQLRIYDKSAETIAHQKAWFLDLWGLPVNADVWRFEFQLRRPALKSRGLNSLEDWIQSRGALWKSLTEDWFSLRLLDNDNASRRTVHPLWKIVQSCAQRFDGAEATLRRHRAVPSLDTSHLAKQIAGGVVGLGARRGVDDLAQVKQLVEKLLDDEFRQRDFAAACQQKAIELGLSARKDAA